MLRCKHRAPQFLLRWGVRKTIETFFMHFQFTVELKLLLALTHQKPTQDVF